MQVGPNIHHKKFLNKPFVNLIIIFVSVTIILSLFGFYYYNVQKDKIVNDRFDYIGSVANFRLLQIEEWLKEKKADLEILKISSPLNTLAAAQLNYRGDVSQEIRNWFTYLKNIYRYDDIILVNSKSNIVYSLTFLKFINRTDSLLCKNALDSNSVLFSDTYEKTADQPDLKFYVPIKSRNTGQKGVGVIILVLKAQSYFEPILGHNIYKSPTMESLLVKPFGDGVIYLNTPRFSGDENDSMQSHNKKALLETSSIAGRKGFVEGIDYKNDEVIAIIQKIPSTAWFLFTKINRSEFYEPTRYLAQIVFLTVMSADLLFALVLFFIWRKNIVANYKKIYLAETEKSKVERRFESLVNGVKDMAIFIFDINGKIISWNKGAERIQGYSSDEIIGKNFSLFYTEEDKIQNRPANNMKDAVEKNGLEDDGWRIKKDGTAFWANSIITPLRDESGKIYGFLKIVRDLTEKRKQDEEIKNSRDFYLKLLDDFPNPVWRSGLDGGLNYFNKAWLNFTGKPLESELGNGWISNIHPDDKDKFIKEYNYSFQNRRGFTSEYRLKNGNDEYRWFVDFGMPYYDFKGNFAGFLGSCYDITDRIKYEDTINSLLRISEKLYSSLEINQILDLLVTESIQLTDAEGGFACIKKDNEFLASRYFNNDHWEYIDKNYSLNSLIIQKFLSTKDSYISNEPADNEHVDYELKNLYKVKQLLSTPLFGSSGELIGFFEIHNKKNKSNFNNDQINLLKAVARNASVAITKSLTYEKLRQTEMQLRNSETELRNLAAQIQYAREAERQQIAREVHDELGQLFTGINLNISLLAELFEQDEKPSVDEILNELHSVQEFVNKGIQTVRDISGSLRSYVLDHLGLIPAVQEYCREVERISNIKCNFETEIDSLILEDEKNVALFRIIQEALTNVMRHAKANIIDIKIYENENNINISVSDNGIGINLNQESLNHSMGILGMKERAIFLGGKFNINSTEGNGTKVLLTIPLDKIKATI